MSVEEETYCRLCADPTPKTQLISPQEDVALSSKISTKLLWINIDITSSSLLPNTICFACFDSLERTWSFLQNARSAQEKLTAIFSSKPSRNDSEDVKFFENPDLGKPVDDNWDTFLERNTEIKVEKINETEVNTTESLLKIDYEIKPECRSDNEFQSDTNFDNALDFSTDSDQPLGQIRAKNALDFSTDSDQPLGQIRAKNPRDFSTDSDQPLGQIRAKKIHPKRKKVHLSKMIDVSSITTTWENFLCSCGRCDSQCKSITELQLHSMQIHNQCCIFKCRDCSKKFLSFKPFITHSRTHINELNYCCEYCNAVFGKKSRLKKHQNKEHINVYLTLCHTCGMLFNCHTKLKEHHTTSGFEFKRKRKQSKINKVFKCEFCKKAFKSKGNLQQHKLVHTDRIREFACYICAKMFYTRGALGTHMSIHEEVKPYKCEHCPVRFKTRGNLQSHLSLHSDAKPFVCEQCGKSFRVKQLLKCHSIVHTDLMPFNCKFCNRKFKFKTAMRVHLRQHTGLKPYKCNYCLWDFTHSSTYKKHMKRRHNIDISTVKYDNIEPHIEVVSVTVKANEQS